jgi:exodeoxyribonuclease-3
MKLASWNINSVRLRLDLVLDRLQKLDLDVLCLQETKTQDEFFPVDALVQAGWPHIVMRGEKSYNGVAIISRLPIEESWHLNWAGREDCRHIAARIAGQTIHNFYVPAGGDEPDRARNPKFGHKLDFLDEMTAYFMASAPHASILVGDLNIAPLEADVWSSRQLRNVVSHTDIEREKLLALIDKGGWLDAVRAHYGDEEILYSWWSYRARDWAASNRGRRLDHIWVSPDHKNNITNIQIDSQTRGAEKPSDHVPLILELSW